MSGGDRLGTLILSIDLESQRGAQERRLDEARAQLLATTKAMAVPATWAVADPMLSADRDAVLSANCGHEIAVLGDRAWLGPGCGRDRLARELSRRFSAPRKAGIPVSTLALRNVEQLAEIDLLLVHGVTAACGIPVESPLAVHAAQPPLRFGLWQPPLGWRVPLAKSWWSMTGWLIRREIKRAIRQRTLLHLRLDAMRFVSASQQLPNQVESLLRYIATKRDAGQLAIKTICELASEALQARAAQPSRSILRPAA